MTFKAYQLLQQAQVVIGYRTYIELVQPLLVAGQQILASGMRSEVERCRQAVELALAGKRVVVISSGDPGIYGMAGVVLEELARREAQSSIALEVVPGVTASCAAAALLGAPLMHDHAVISLSDLLTPWELIARRLELAAAADLVVVLYNPRSHGRSKQVLEAQRIMLGHRPPATPVGVVWQAMRPGQQVEVSTLDQFTALPLDMTSIVLIGNSETRRVGAWMVTPRGYQR